MVYFINEWCDVTDTVDNNWRRFLEWLPKSTDCEKCKGTGIDPHWAPSDPGDLLLPDCPYCTPEPK